MGEAWSVENVLALAPDATSVTAGRALASAASWTGQGVATDPAALWGLCAGSGKKPYQTVVDLTGPAFKCSCPSRKFPCKHALGLLLLWSAGGVPGAGDPPDWAATWLADRSARAERASTRAPRSTAPDPAAAAARAAARDAKVAAGLAELDQWLADQVRTGLAGLERAGYRPFEELAARMVDAQAPALATAVRRLPGVAASGEGWHVRLLGELALLRLTVAAHGRLAELPDGLAATVRTRIGYPVAREDVLATPPLADSWEVLGLRDAVEERLTARRVWLQGSTTGRKALVLSFGVGGQPVDASLVPGTVIDADVHYYPAAAPLRALVGARRGEPLPLTRPRGASVAAAAAAPWPATWPVVVDDAVPVPGDPHWTLVDAVGAEPGDSLTLLPGVDLWRLLAVSGGRPLTVAGTLGFTGFRALSCAVPAADGWRWVPL